MKKGNAVLIFAVCLISILFAAGCSSQSGKNKEQLPEDYRTGNIGLEMQFRPNSPPDKVYIDDPQSLNFLLQVQNKGADDVSAGDVKISLQGYDQAFLKIIDDPVMIIGAEGLYGKSDVYPTGSITFKGWNTNPLITFPGDVYTPTFQALACYYYTTTATPLVCIDPSPYSAVAQDEVCAVHDVTMSGGQGGPVGVTKVEESIISQKKAVLFRIYVANLNSGVVFDRNVPLATCSNKNLKVSETDKIDVRAELGNTPIVCTPSKIILSNGVGMTTCQGTLTNPSENAQAYSSQLKITLDYGYSSAILKQVKIIKTEFKGSDSLN